MTNLVLEYTNFSFRIPVTLSAASYSLYHWDATSRFQVLSSCYYQLRKHQLLATIQFRIFYFHSSDPTVKFKIQNACDYLCFRRRVKFVWHPTDEIRTNSDWEHGTETWTDRREKSFM